MKKHLFFFAAFVMSAAMLATQGLSARKRVIKVQGHPHELLTGLIGGKEDAKFLPQLTGTSTDSIKITDIQCWAGGLAPTITPNYVDSAILVGKWTDLNTGTYPDSILIWGYKWNTISIYDDPEYGPDTVPVHKYTIDMIRAVANADCNLAHCSRIRRRETLSSVDSGIIFQKKISVCRLSSTRSAP